MIRYLIIFIFLSKSFILLGQLNIKSKDYLDNNSFIFQESTCLKSLGFNNYNLFIIGERHGGKTNNDIFKKFIVFFNKTYGIKHVVLEESFSRGMLINLYLKTENEQILNLLTKYSIKQELSFINWLKCYNKQREDSLKLIVHGVDYDQITEQVMFANLLYFLLPNNKPSKEIQNVIFRLKNISTLYSFERTKLVNKILQSYSSYPLEYKNLYSYNYPIFKEAIENWNKSIKLQHFNYNIEFDSTTFYYREKFIYNNFITLSKKYSNEHFIAKFGVGHIGLKKFLFEKQECKTFVNLLNQDLNSAFYNGVASFFINYTSIRRRKFSKNILGKELYNYITKISNNEVIITCLNNGDSPFYKFSKNNFQYIITPPK